MKKLLCSFGTLLLAGSLGACATVTRSPNTAWEVNTVPAGATVATSNGHYCQATPCYIAMPRRSHFTATITHAGYITATVKVRNSVSGEGAAAFLGNGLIGGVPGAAVDIITGSTLDLVPRSSMIHLERSADYADELYGNGSSFNSPDPYGMRPYDTISITRF